MRNLLRAVLLVSGLAGPAVLAAEDPAIIPVKGGAEMGLPLAQSASPRLQPMKKRPWAERHTATLPLASPKAVDAEVKRLLKLSWEKG